MGIPIEEYSYFKNILLEKSGMDLGDGKDYLLESRLRPVLDQLGYSNFSDLIDHLKHKNDDQLMKSIINLMTTNESLFFRDLTPFTLLKEKILPSLIEARKDVKKISIWSAACSTGQEPYSLSMLISSLVEELPLSDWSFEIMATDLSDSVLSRASEGIYSYFEVQRGLPGELLKKYFTQHQNGWQIIDAVKKRITFKQVNLIDHFGHLGSFDIIMCRNVLIYFGLDVKREVLSKVHQCLKSDGFLFLGGAETLLGVTDSFENWDASAGAIYRKKQTKQGEY